MNNPTQEPRPEVNLDNENGNVFNLIGICKRALKRSGASAEHIEAFQDDVTSGDYDHALSVMAKYCEVN